MLLTYSLWIISITTQTAGGSGGENNRAPKCILFCVNFAPHNSSKLILQRLPKLSRSNRLAHVLLWIIYCSPFQRAKQKPNYFWCILHCLSHRCKAQLLVHCEELQTTLASRWSNYRGVRIYFVCSTGMVGPCRQPFFLLFAETRIKQCGSPGESANGNSLVNAVWQEK